MHFIGAEVNNCLLCPYMNTHTHIVYSQHQGHHGFHRSFCIPGWRTEDDLSLALTLPRQGAWTGSCCGWHLSRFFPGLDSSICFFFAVHIFQSERKISPSSLSWSWFEAAPAINPYIESQNYWGCAAFPAMCELSSGPAAGKELHRYCKAFLLERRLEPAGASGFTAPTCGTVFALKCGQKFLKHKPGLRKILHGVTSPGREEMFSAGVVTTVIHLEQLSAGMGATMKTRIAGKPNRPAKSPECWRTSPGPSRRGCRCGSSKNHKQKSVLVWRSETQAVQFGSTAGTVPPQTFTAGTWSSPADKGCLSLVSCPPVPALLAVTQPRCAGRPRQPRAKGFVVAYRWDKFEQQSSGIGRVKKNHRRQCPLKKAQKSIFPDKVESSAASGSRNSLLEGWSGAICFFGENTKLLEAAASVYIAQDIERLMHHLFEEQEPPAAFSSHSSCMRRGEVKSLQTRKDAFFSSCHGFFRRCFFQHSPRTCTSLLLENTAPSCIDKEKAAQDKRFLYQFCSPELISFLCHAVENLKLKQVYKKIYSCRDHLRDLRDKSSAIFLTIISLKISVIYYERITFYIHISIQYLESHNTSIECFQIL
ncbi:hypothetical protein EK904_002123 [Melospiza melodia maxima]|nr:hypothetical protein EK904_002123 [Melospiza melodia maxima]